MNYHIMEFEIYIQQREKQIEQAHDYIEYAMDYIYYLEGNKEKAVTSAYSEKQ